jgi:hypothetical protein
VWHLAQHRYDTASTYFGMVMIMPELSLDQYQPSFCGEYLSARSMTDRGADLNESWSRWSHIGEYYPVARYILMPIHVRAFGGWSDSEGTN